MASVDQVVKDELRGQPFIGEEDGEGLSRRCVNCGYATVEADTPIGLDYAGKCLISEPPKLFSADPLPDVLDGKQVGHYCPFFDDYSNFEEF